jgi:hypothetical protein
MRRFMAAIVPALLCALPLSLPGCGGTRQGSPENPAPARINLQFGAVNLATVTSLKLCVARARFIPADSAQATVQVDLPTAGEVAAGASDAVFGTVEIANGNYARIEVDASSGSCASQKSVQLSNAHGSFSITEGVTLRFQGSGAIDSSVKAVRLDLQAFVDQFTAIDDGTEIKPSTDAITGGLSVAGEIYVQSGASGTGSRQAPFGKIQDALNVAKAGDSVVVFAGNYSETLQTVRAGTQGAPITLRAEGARGTVRVAASGRVLTVAHPHFHVANLIIDGQYGPDDAIRVNDAANGFKLSGSEILRAGRDCVDILSPSDVIIEQSLIHHCLWYSSGPQLAHGIVTDAVHNLTIRATEVHSFSGDGIAIGAMRTAPGWDQVLIEDSSIWLAPLGSAENGFAAGAVPGDDAIHMSAYEAGSRSNLTVRNVVVSGIRGKSSAQAAFRIKEKVNVVVDRVTVKECSYGFALRGTQGGFSGSWATIKNAVLHDVSVGVRYEDVIQTAKIYNTTFGRLVTTPFEDVATGNSLDIQNFLILAGSRPTEASGPNNLAVTSAAFVNAASDDYRLVVGSSAVNAGATLSEVTGDRDGVSRPQGGAYDIGAYER